VTYLDSSEARYTAAAAMSAGSPSSGSTIMPRMTCMYCSSASSFRIMSPPVLMNPTMIALDRMFSAP
jgi:hypothetical protein